MILENLQQLINNQSVTYQTSHYTGYEKLVTITSMTLQG